MTVWLLDTGPLVAFYDRSDADHAWARERWGRAPVPLLTCEAVLAEAAYLLREHDGLPGSKLLALFERQAITAPFRLEDHAGPVARLMEKNHDQDMQLGDAYVVRMSELHRDCRVRERGPPRRSATRNLGYDNIKNRPLYNIKNRPLYNSSRVKPGSPVRMSPLPPGGSGPT
ncbi:MAG: PIN domain-containing protein [Verrucomicrobiales bacterium]|nr:PIN domain-containing protein [Verrucomicrobiales bacterium]